MTRARRPTRPWPVGLVGPAGLVLLSAPACFQRGKKRAAPPDAGVARSVDADAGSSASAALPPLPPAP